jgi:hypothetical protein
MRAPALAELHEIFLRQDGSALELFAGKHYRCDTANAELGKDRAIFGRPNRNHLASQLSFERPPNLRMPPTGLQALLDCQSIRLCG